MKYTEGKFGFPVKIYDGLSIMKAVMKEEKRLDQITDADDIDELELESGDWVMGVVKIPVEEVIAWSDNPTQGKTMKEMADEGFSETKVITKTLGNFECLWKLAKFEEELDKFVDRYAEGIDKMAEDLLNQKTLAIQAKKPKKWRLWTSR